MRIVLVDPRADSRPYDHGLAAGLARLGHDVELVSCRFHHADLPPAPGVRIREPFYRAADVLRGRARSLARGAEHPLDLAALVGRLARRRPDVVHVEWLPLHAADRAAWRLVRRALDVPAVFTAHNAVPRQGAPSELRQAARDARSFDRVIVHSAYGARALVERLGVDPGRVRQIPHGALTGYRDVAPVAPAVPEGVPVVLLLGLLRPYKGLATLLDAWPAVRARIPDAVLHVAGRPFGEPAVARLAATPGVVADLRYVTAGEFAGALARADCVALPYRAIDQSGVLFAALALGRPLVVTDVGGFREVVGEHGAGLVVPPEDPAALADALARVLGDRALRDGLAAGARAAADGPFSWDAIACRTAAVYAELVG